MGDMHFHSCWMNLGMCEIQNIAFVVLSASKTPCKTIIIITIIIFINVVTIIIIIIIVVIIIYI